MRRRSTRDALLLAAMLLGGCGGSGPGGGMSGRMSMNAGEDVRAAMQPPAQLGLCASCHGANGQARQPGIPNLAGQRSAYLLKAMQDYKSGTRDVPQMRAALGPLDEAQLRELADWYASRSACAAQAVHR